MAEDTASVASAASGGPLCPKILDRLLDEDGDDIYSSPPADAAGGAAC